MEDLNLPGGIPVDTEYGGFEVLEEEDVADSAYSQASSIHNFRVEHGRRYHEYKEGHPFPYDEVSKENEASLHHVILLLLGDRYFLSPIDESRLRCIADVGTGSGFWAEGVAQRYPNAEVIGFDTIHHPLSVEPNCSFIVQDVTDDWVLDNPDMLFDLVHIRNLFVGVKDWKPVYQQCFEKMRSGGWIEQYEIEINAKTDDPNEPADSSMIMKLRHTAEDMARTTGRDFHISMKMKHLIEEAGFVDVQEQKVKLPLGPWASDPKLKDIGRFFERFYKTGLQGWLMHICTRFLGKKPEEVNAWCAQAFQEINSRQHRYYFLL
ncbi:hypothetical protein A1O7_02460 [Cladophialophora yegresii CBS 114405]|uniref:Methyltransferase n=1 Tax=Cladophialophora yegresii CBS 114405 TaxID=1182544 RepID=W9W1S1_9EURO|nr:uncharacterized protein A1O7_02460 [Cladophialophora yegresii CBS 114405]EXJ62027.1 hypothetical protein A1O7_02460 [Cladophialophora yegresii CBS 114405]